MKTNTIKWKIFKYNLIIIMSLIVTIGIIFNVAIKFYTSNEIVNQLERIANRAANATLEKGPDFFPPRDEFPPPPKKGDEKDVFMFYMMLDRSLKEPLSILNADYILLDKHNNRIATASNDYFAPPTELSDKIATIFTNSKNNGTESYKKFNINNIEYVAIIKPLSEKNNFSLNSIIIYSSLQKINQLQLGINLLLFSVLIFHLL